MKPKHKDLEATIDAGELTKELVAQYGRRHLEGVVRAGFEDAVLPFMIATRFRFKNLKDVREDTFQFQLVNDAKSGRELLELYLFERLSRNKDLPLTFESFLDQPLFADFIDQKIIDLHTKVQWKIYDWSTVRIFDQLAELTGNYDLKKMGAISTPHLLVKDMVNRLPALNGDVLDPACGRGSFLIEIRDRMLQNGVLKADAVAACHGWDIDPSKAYIAQALLDPEGKYRPTIECRNALEAEVDMKFDLVIGNPPYQNFTEEEGGSGGAGTTWSKFVNLANSLVKDDGIISFVTPGSWLRLDSRITGAVFTQNQTLWVRTKIQDYFKGVGSSFTAWAVQKTPYSKPTEFPDDGVSIDFREVNGVPLNCVKGTSILVKIRQLQDSGKYPLIVVKQDKTHKYNWKNDPKNRHLYCEEQGPPRPYRMHHTNPVMCWGAYEPMDYYLPKVVMTFSGNPTPIFYNTEIGTTYQISGHIVVQNATEGANLVKLLSSKLYQFYRLSGKTGGMNSIHNFNLPLLDLKVEWTDDAIYDVFGLTVAERKIVDDFK